MQPIVRSDSLMRFYLTSSDAIDMPALQEGGVNL